MDEAILIFNNFKSLLYSIAYRICHSKEEAEDILQEVQLKWLDQNIDSIENPKAFLSKLVVNRSINYLNSAQAQRVDYYGPWIPQPEIERTEDPLVGKEKITYALLVVLEQLTPQERVVFLMKEVFDYSHKELSELLEITPENSRKLLSRAKKAIQATDISVEPSSNLENQKFIDLFNRSIEKGDLTPLLDFLTADAKMSIDGGKKRRAPLRTLIKPTRIFAFLKGVLPHGFFGDERFVTEINEQPCLLIKEKQQLISILFLGLNPEKTKVQHIFIINNPDKLKNIS
ncbi:RNA polymerase subunit sigma-70 [Enterococcus silesiacus]|uniref:RNA polymerase subunit sigma-70 n=1 Tax=Enterococcus silesiacus TaxID=332949 RepID=A0A0S3KB00_9ENTE|nr:sigma-70 family RNA polymerase sigma factor [Enterococcus silesiacus]ALS01463.1 RNA polymerase subunit sigma-70 [Enterococcus silesiacus]OJG87739.1 sigma-70 family RNA polymerase sigma factor [Enterococcus silesiacus]